MPCPLDPIGEIGLLQVDSTGLVPAVHLTTKHRGLTGSRFQLSPQTSEYVYQTNGLRRSVTAKGCDSDILNFVGLLKGRRTTYSYHLQHMCVYNHTIYILRNT